MSQSIEPSEDVSSAYSVTASTFEDISVGTTVSLSKTLTDDDVHQFAQVSGDTNPIHLDSDYAEDTRFEDRIAHGVLVAGVVSAALARLPGVVVYLSQEMKFLSPVYIGDEVTAECEIVEALGNNQYRIQTTVETDEAVVIDGEATVLIENEP